MSYNIDSVETKKLDAFISRKDLKSLIKKYADSGDLPEDNFLEEIEDDPDADGLVTLQSLRWCGKGSNDSFREIFPKVAKKIKGRVEAIFCWEGGDSYSGIIIEDGKITECDVEMTLVPIGTQEMKRVILESPYALDGEIERNIIYARRCVRDSVMRGEAPIASHLLFTQEGILRDEIPEERALGIEAGLAWTTVSEGTVVYVDYGYSSGMNQGIARARFAGLPVEVRMIGKNDGI